MIARPLKDAEEHGTLGAVASTYSAENDALYDGISRAGTRVVTFAPILRDRSFPLPEALGFLASLGSWGFGTPIEMEFAVTLSVRPGARKKLGIVQMRPLLISHDADDAVLGEVAQSDLICQSDQVLGHGAIRDLVISGERPIGIQFIFNIAAPIERGEQVWWSWPSEGVPTGVFSVGVLNASAKREIGLALADWLISPEGQAAIARHVALTPVNRTVDFRFKDGRSPADLAIVPVDGAYITEHRADIMERFQAATARR